MIQFRVREVAERRGLNIQQLADKSGIAYSTVLDLWHDRVMRIDKRTIQRLCEALEVMPGDLLVMAEGSDSKIALLDMVTAPALPA